MAVFAASAPPNLLRLFPHSTHDRFISSSRKSSISFCTPPGSEQFKFDVSVSSGRPRSHSFGSDHMLTLDEVRSNVCLSIGAHLIPHPGKIDKGGEDAFLVSHQNGGVIAVADGVSGWAERNVDPSLFSRELMANASSLLNLGVDNEVNNDPLMLLKEAHAATSSVGSATMIIAMLERGRILKIANVGDCGLRVIRNGRVIHSSSPQEHYFDCPYQLSSEAVGQTYLDAVVSSVELMVEDTVVMGTDGLFDNVFDHEIVSTVSRHSDLTNTAKALCDLAHEHAKDPSFDSPYSVEARAKGFDVPLWKKILGMKLTGGKLDDVTVIVGRVVESNSQQHETPV